MIMSPTAPTTMMHVCMKSVHITAVRPPENMQFNHLCHAACSLKFKAMYTRVSDVMARTCDGEDGGNDEQHND